MVCFTESTQAGLDYLISERGFAPWGIVFRKETIWDRGGSPVWYARPDQWTDLTGELKSWAVRTEPGGAQWLHEREWRVPATGRPPSFRFEPSEVHAMICGDRIGWPEGPPDEEGAPTTPSWAAGIQSWYWSPRESGCGSSGTSGVSARWSRESDREPWASVSEGLYAACLYRSWYQRVPRNSPRATRARSRCWGSRPCVAICRFDHVRNFR